MLRIACAILLLGFSGCLVSEVEQYTLVINSDGRTGVLTIVRRNIQSDSPDSAQQRKDFQELLDNRISDTYLLRQMEQGFYVKDRSLSFEKGVLVWKERLLVSDISKVIPDYRPGEPVHMAVHDTSNVSIRTNGRMTLQNDSLAIEWPAEATTLELKATKRNFTATSRFSALYQQYRKKHR
jgi:hypothetical protein